MVPKTRSDQGNCHWPSVLCGMEKVGKRVPGRSDRSGISLVELLRLFPSDEAAEAWLVGRRWPNKIACPKGPSG